MTGNSGVRAILEVLKIIEDAGIPCCLVGTSALRYYGARRMSDEWQICVPTDQWEDATTLIAASSVYKKANTEYEMPNLVQTYPRYVLTVVEERLLEDFALVILPGKAAHLDGQCQPANFERSQTNLPYPKLQIFVQSLLDVQHSVDLADVIDGMDLTEAWGQENLDLRGGNDIEWAQWANDRMIAISKKPTGNSFSTGIGSRQKLWDGLVSTKQKRGGIKYPPERYATRFRVHGSPDPRTRDREHV